DYLPSMSTSPPLPPPDLCALPLHDALPIYRLRQLGGLGVLVHAAGLVWQRAARVRQHDSQIRMTLHGAGENEPHRSDADLDDARSEEHTSELQSRVELVGRLQLEKNTTDEK